MLTKYDLRVRCKNYLFLGALLLAGCISHDTPGDLALVSVQTVNWRDQVEISGSGANRTLLKVEFTSATNLSQFVIEHSYNLGNTAILCNRPNDRTTLSFSDVFWRGIRLGVHKVDPIEQHLDIKKGQFTYYIFINVADGSRPHDIPPQEEYDLHQKPEDVCFYVEGGNESGRGYRSNTVVIPKDAIGTALQKVSIDSGN